MCWLILLRLNEMITITIDEQGSHLNKLDELYALRSTLQKQNGRKPTFTEWAQAAECSMEALLHDFRLGLHARKQLRLAASPSDAYGGGHRRSPPNSLLHRINKAYLVLSIVYEKKAKFKRDYKLSWTGAKASSSSLAES